MIVKDYNYPLLAFKEGDKNIYATNNNFGIVSKGGDKFYKHLTIIDSKGNVFRLEKSRVKGLAPFSVCLKYFQKMWEMELYFDSVGTISLDKLKDKIMNHVSQNTTHWLVLDTIEGIHKQIYSAKTFKDLILIFR